MTIFLIIYCPSRVGIKKPLHVTVGNRKRGRMVVIMCGTRRSIATRSIRGIIKKTPIKTSITPSSTIKVSAVKGTNIPRVLLNKSVTNGPAGESPKSFKAPNHTKTTKRARWANKNALYCVFFIYFVCI